MKHARLTLLTLFLAASLSVAALPKGPELNIPDAVASLTSTHKAQIANRVAHWAGLIKTALSASTMIEIRDTILSKRDLTLRSASVYREAYVAELVKQIAPLLEAKALPADSPKLQWIKQINIAILFSKLPQANALDVQVKLLSMPQKAMQLMGLRGLARQKKNLFRGETFTTITAAMSKTLPTETNPLILSACCDVLNLSRSDAKTLLAPKRAAVAQAATATMVQVVARLRANLSSGKIAFDPSAPTSAAAAKTALKTLRDNMSVLTGKPATTQALQLTMDVADGALIAYEAGLDQGEKSNLAATSAAVLVEVESAFVFLSKKSKNYIGSALRTRSIDERLPNVGEAVVDKWADELKGFGITGPSAVK
ncbi:MAG: hypothetical protein HN909_09435 [Phycisphaerales bacterium]|jgi:hypothetical protein|nr:hypothetical protein [Phycisphaerales bacterium]MBT7171972.1 hypothetical protein [Phycisphaerales bacterium]